MSAETSAEALARELGAPTGDVRGARIVPMMCERHESRALLDRAGWLFELKLDGVRIVADKRGASVSLSYRKQRDATDSYAEIVDALAKLPEDRVVLDGEIVAFDANGRPDFQLLAQRFQSDPKRARRMAAGQVPVVYIVFDCLAIGGYDLRGFPLEARKEILNRVVPPEAGGLVRQHPTFDRGGDLFRFCEEHSLEGVVAKKLGSPYRPGERTSEWLKIKREHDCELVVVGWTEGESARSTLGALDVASWEGDELVYRGKVGSGLSAATILTLLPRLEALQVDEPVTTRGVYSAAKQRFYCKPELVVSVRYGMMQRDGLLRFPTFRGLRPDVDPKDCTLNSPA
ncbi:MAG: non-homologous end-joining DNA ligase [Labilithrix sp.]|nr:non-homologous end-joining DNA ligase [Labilithrix sp.]MCW5809491.1 non-homologous end-joining DNA ligase [Labilithrix sp.]